MSFRALAIVVRHHRKAAVEVKRVVFSSLRCEQLREEIESGKVFEESRDCATLCCAHAFRCENFLLCLSMIYVRPFEFINIKLTSIIKSD